MARVINRLRIQQKVAACNPAHEMLKFKKSGKHISLEKIHFTVAVDDSATPSR